MDDLREELINILNILLRSSAGDSNVVRQRILDAIARLDNNRSIPDLIEMAKRESKLGKTDIPVTQTNKNQGLLERDSKEDPSTLPREWFACPKCKAEHVDRGEWASRPHHVHRCGMCGHEWDRGHKSFGVEFGNAPGINSTISNMKFTAEAQHVYQCPACNRVIALPPNTLSYSCSFGHLSRECVRIPSAHPAPTVDAATLPEWCDVEKLARMIGECRDDEHRSSYICASVVALAVLRMQKEAGADLLSVEECAKCIAARVDAAVAAERGARTERSDG